MNHHYYRGIALSCCLNKSEPYSGRAIAYLAVGGASWAGRHGIDGSSFPISYEIDYIRVYSQPYVAD
ncbi:MAG: hypothetical protein WBD51_06230 [Burkholderiaceae bacterium]